MNTETGELRPYEQLTREQRLSERWVPVSDHVADIVARGHKAKGKAAKKAAKKARRRNR
jgi:hypothetical protein